MSGQAEGCTMGVYNMYTILQHTAQQWSSQGLNKASCVCVTPLSLFRSVFVQLFSTVRFQMCVCDPSLTLSLCIFQLFSTVRFQMCVCDPSLSLSLFLFVSLSLSPLVTNEGSSTGTLIHTNPTVLIILI